MNEKLLIIDDQTEASELLANMIQSTFPRLVDNIHTAASAIGGMNLIKTYGESAFMLFLDNQLPEYDNDIRQILAGARLAQLMRLANPNTYIIGTSSISFVGCNEIRQKPYKFEELELLIDQKLR